MEWLAACYLRIAVIMPEKLVRHKPEKVKNNDKSTGQKQRHF